MLDYKRTNIEALKQPRNLSYFHLSNTPSIQGYCMVRKKWYYYYYYYCYYYYYYYYWQYYYYYYYYWQYYYYY